MTEFARALVEEIRRDGPMRLDRYMGRCVAHYYATRDPFGARGDFITAPEVSQMFGELVGVWCASTYEVMGSPKRVLLVEFGPGRGTLMADLLRAAKVSPRFLEATEVHLVETSPTLRARQAEALADFEVHWHDSLDTVPHGPIIVIANEFFDALPVRQLVRRGDQFFERCVTADAAGTLCFTLPEQPASPALLPPFALAARDGDVIEMGPAREDVAHAIGKRLSKHSSALIAIDYGHTASAPGDTLQALSKHRHANVLEAPGEADLTAHVDFATLAHALGEAGAAVLPSMTQGAFLLAMGLREREAALKQALDARGRLQIAAQAHRLAAEGQMGHLFKVLAATHPDVPPPYPFTQGIA